jgi:hypothetical protein
MTITKPPPVVGPNRADRIAMAKTRIAELEPEFLQLKNEYEDAVGGLKRAERSFDEGERVEVTKTCRRGCCDELQYTGVVAERQKHSYVVRRDSDGHLFEHVYDSDMRRLATT